MTTTVHEQDVRPAGRASATGTSPGAGAPPQVRGPSDGATVTAGALVGAPAGATVGALIGALTSLPVLPAAGLGAVAGACLAVLAAIWWVVVHYPDPPSRRGWGRVPDPAGARRAGAARRATDPAARR